MTEANKFFPDKILIILSFLLAFFCLVRAWNYGQASRGIDFYQFWAVGQEISQEKKINIYSDDIRRSLGSEFLEKAQDSKSLRFILAADYRKTLQTYSTPFLYSLFGIFSSKDYDRAYTIYQFICMACMVFTILMLSKLLRLTFVFSMLFLVFLTSCFEPYFSDLRVANVNQIQLGLLVLFLWFQSRYDWKTHNFLGGIVLGSLIMFKPNLMFLILMLSISWLINRRFKKMILAYTGIAISVIVAVIFSSIIFGSMQCWFDWLKAGISIAPGITTVGLGNYAFSRLIMDCFGMDLTKYLITVLVSITALFIWLGSQKELSENRRNPNSDLFNDILIVSAGCLIYLLSAPLVWLHYYMLAVPSAIFMLRPAGYFKLQVNRRSTIISRTLAIFAMIMLSLAPAHALFGWKSAYYTASTTVIRSTR